MTISISLSHKAIFICRQTFDYDSLLISIWIRGHEHASLINDVRKLIPVIFVMINCVLKDALAFCRYPLTNNTYNMDPWQIQSPDAF